MDGYERITFQGLPEEIRQMLEQMRREGQHVDSEEEESVASSAEEEDVQHEVPTNHEHDDAKQGESNQEVPRNFEEGIQEATISEFLEDMTNNRILLYFAFTVAVGTTYIMKLVWGTFGSEYIVWNVPLLILFAVLLSYFCMVIYFESRSRRRGQMGRGVNN